jgi:hypothetical protein
MVSRRTALVVAALIASLAPACGSSTPTIGAGSRSIIRVTVDPNPVPPVQNVLTGSVSAAYKITLTELGGLGAEVVFVSSSVYDKSTGTQVALNYFDSADLLVFVGENRIEANGTLDIPQTTSYLLPDLSVDATMTVSVQVKDDHDNVINQSLLVPIEIPAPAPQ